MTLAGLITTVVTIAIVMGVILTTCAYLILVERKISAWMQNRVGPNRVGPFGLLQPLADGLKFLLKEEVVPDQVDKVLYIVAPALSVLTTMFAFAVVPFGPTDPGAPGYQFVIAPGMDIGILFIFAIGSLAVYGVILGGWSSNNKYSMLGCLRSSAQVISYEIPLGMSILGVVILTGSLNLESILQRQAEGGILTWNVWAQPLGLLLFFTSALAESNRMPFDLPECEQELVGGYHTEYSALKFGMFFLGEYTHVITISYLTSILFFGGWHLPIIAEPGSAYAGAWAVKVLVLMAKVGLTIIFIMLLRWTLPRFRYDQLMGLAWKVLIPIGIANLLLVMTVREFGLDPLWMLPASIVLIAGLAAVNARQANRGARRMAIPSTMAIGR